MDVLLILWSTEDWNFIFEIIKNSKTKRHTLLRTSQVPTITLCCGLPTGLIVLPCSSTNCKNNAVCEFVSGVPRCLCLAVDSCSSVGVPVCGSDGSTYDSDCHMRAISCREGRDVYVQHEGKCGEYFARIILLRGKRVASYSEHNVIFGCH